MSLLAGLTDPVFMAKIAEHHRIVDRLAEQMGCNPSKRRPTHFGASRP